MSQIIPSPENPLYSVETVADMLDVTRYTIRNWIKDGSLPAHKINGQWKIQKSDLVIFVNKEYGDG